MTKISSYENVNIPTLSDKLIGTDVNSANKTVNFTIADVLSLSASNTVTFYELQTLIVNNDLIVGGLYIISDYQTIYDQPDFTSLGAAKTIVATNTGPVEPLIVRAVTTNKLSEVVLSTVHPKDYIKYDVNFTQTEVMGVAAKGRITFRTDEYNNSTSYDHRAIVFKRYLDPITELFTVINDNGLNSNVLIPTFGADCYSNNLGLCISSSAFLLPNNVFGDSAHDNNFGTNTYNNTFGINCIKNNVYGSFITNNIDDNFQFNQVKGDVTNVDFTGTKVYLSANTEICNAFDAGAPTAALYLTWLDVSTGTIESQLL